MMAPPYRRGVDDIVAPPPDPVRLPVDGLRTLACGATWRFADVVGLEWDLTPHDLTIEDLCQLAGGKAVRLPPGTDGRPALILRPDPIPEP